MFWLLLLVSTSPTDLGLQFVFFLNQIWKSEKIQLSIPVFVAEFIWKTVGILLSSMYVYVIFFIICYRLNINKWFSFSMKTDI